MIAALILSAAQAASAIEALAEHGSLRLVVDVASNVSVAADAPADCVDCAAGGDGLTFLVTLEVDDGGLRRCAVQHPETSRFLPAECRLRGDALRIVIPGQGGRLVFDLEPAENGYRGDARIAPPLSPFRPRIGEATLEPAVTP